MPANTPNTDTATAADMFADACGIRSAPDEPRRRIRCHHDYAQRETHDGRDVWVTRKGAISARLGGEGIAPGSMGTAAFIVRGLGNPASMCSAAHGAGRTKAKQTFDLHQLEQSMSGRVWLADKAQALLDEASAAYRDIYLVTAAQADMCAPVEELTAVVNHKGL